MPLTPKTRETIDALRPDAADLEAPEFRELAAAMRQDEQVRLLVERSRAMDRAIRAAQAEIPVPQGLADRILQNLHLPAPANSADGGQDSVELVASRATVKHQDRRRKLTWLAVTGAALVLLILTGSWIAWPRSIDPRSAEELAAAGVHWAETAQHWTDLNPNHLQVPADHALSSRVRGFFTGWKSFHTKYDRQTIAFSLRGHVGDAWLFATRSQPTFLAPDSRPERLPTTGGISVAAWREGPMLYVLVCRERQQRLDDYLIPRKLASFPRPTHVLTVQTPKKLDNGDEA
jgi:hypothetical protein